jgi:hypothetical protein
MDARARTVFLLSYVPCVALAAVTAILAAVGASASVEHPYLVWFVAFYGAVAWKVVRVLGGAAVIAGVALAIARGQVERDWTPWASPFCCGLLVVMAQFALARQMAGRPVLQGPFGEFRVEVREETAGGLPVANIGVYACSPGISHCTHCGGYKRALRAAPVPAVGLAYAPFDAGMDSWSVADDGGGTVRSGPWESLAVRLVLNSSPRLRIWCVFPRSETP